MLHQDNTLVDRFVYSYHLITPLYNYVIVVKKRNMTIISGIVTLLMNINQIQTCDHTYTKLSYSMDSL